MLNVTVMTGRLVETPELRKTNSDIAVTSFRIAVKRDVAQKGEDTTDFFDAVAWRGTAEFICKYFEKGALIQVAGRLQNRHWKDKQEQARVTAEIVVDRAYFGESKNKDGDSGGQSADIDPFGSDAAAPPPGFNPFA